ncbi:MAG: hypothetical protein M5R36_10275 [Deltaproteobacteria bacterium]|nr:hypothetical protein [Deltaproteobacteria bacterium]
MSTDAPAAGCAAALVRGAGRRRPARGATLALAALYSAVVLAWFAGNRLLGDVWWLMPLTAAPQALLAPWPFALLAALWARSRAALAGVAMAGVVLAAAFGGLFLPKPAPPPAPDTFRLVTHNLLYTNRALDQEEAAIRALAPDAVTLQEVQPSQWRALTAALHDLYPLRRDRRAAAFRHDGDPEPAPLHRHRQRGHGRAPRRAGDRAVPPKPPDPLGRPGR